MASDIKEFNARWSRLNWVLTVFLGGIGFIFIPCFIFYKINTLPPNNEIAHFFFLLLGVIPAILLAALFFAPIKYRITDSKILVKRLGPDVVIPIKSIEDIRHLDKQSLGDVLRTCGVNGFCGSYGLFYSSKLGEFRGYLTNKENLILIKTSDNKNFMLSPENPDDFLDVAAKAQKLNSF